MVPQAEPAADQGLDMVRMPVHQESDHLLHMHIPGSGIGIVIPQAEPAADQGFDMAWMPVHQESDHLLHLPRSGIGVVIP